MTIHCQHLANKHCTQGKICCYFCSEVRNCAKTWLSERYAICKMESSIFRVCNIVALEIKENGFYVPIYKPRKIKAKFIGERIEQI